MPVVHVLPDGLASTVDPGVTALEASLRAGVGHAHVCGGHARCSTCRVHIEATGAPLPARGDDEEAIARRLGFDDEVRLACRLRVEADMTVRRLVIDERDRELADQTCAAALHGPAGDERRVTILFSDLRGFTAFAEDQLAYDVIHVLNRHFHAAGDIIGRCGGVVDKTMGDGLMAVFGVDGAPGHAAHAVQAGLGMLESMPDLNGYLARCYGRTLDLGVGIHTGTAVIGAVGATPADYRTTAIGDAVNLASRIEQANKGVGTRLLVSEATFSEVAPHARVGRELHLELKGKRGVQILREILALEPD